MSYERGVRVLLASGFYLAVVSCGGGGGGNALPNPPSLNPGTNADIAINGVAQKGPFSTGATVRAYPVDTDGTRDEGEAVTVEVGRQGTFNLTVGWEGMTELIVEGDYESEFDGATVSTNSALRAFASVVDGSDVNVNLWTHAAAERASVVMVQNDVELEEALAIAATDLYVTFGLPEAISATELDITQGDGPFGPHNASLLLFSATYAALEQDGVDAAELIQDFADNAALDGSAGVVRDRFLERASTLDIDSLADTIRSFGAIEPPSTARIEELDTTVLQSIFEVPGEQDLTFLERQENAPVWLHPTVYRTALRTNEDGDKFISSEEWVLPDGSGGTIEYATDGTLSSWHLTGDANSILAFRDGDRFVHEIRNGSTDEAFIYDTQAYTSGLRPLAGTAAGDACDQIAHRLTVEADVLSCESQRSPGNLSVNAYLANLTRLEPARRIPAVEFGPGQYRATLDFADPTACRDQERRRCDQTFQYLDDFCDLRAVTNSSDPRSGSVSLQCRLAAEFARDAGLNPTVASQLDSACNLALSRSPRFCRTFDLVNALGVCSNLYNDFLDRVASNRYSVQMEFTRPGEPTESTPRRTFDILGAGDEPIRFQKNLGGKPRLFNTRIDPSAPSVDDAYSFSVSTDCVESGVYFFERNGSTQAAEVEWMPVPVSGSDPDRGVFQLEIDPGAVRDVITVISRGAEGRLAGGDVVRRVIENSPPVALSQSYSTGPNGFAAELVGVDARGAEVSYRIGSSPALGSVNTLQLPVFQYVPDSGATGTDSFTFIASTLAGDSEPGTITINIENSDEEDPSDSVGGDLDPFAGSWTVTAIAQSPAPECDGEEDVYSVTIEEEDGSYSVSFLGTTVFGTLTGNDLSVSANVSYPSDGGTSTAEISATFNDSGTVSGTSNFSFSAGNFSCTGTSQLSGSKD